MKRVLLRLAIALAIALELPPELLAADTALASVFVAFPPLMAFCTI